MTIISHALLDISYNLYECACIHTLMQECTHALHIHTHTYTCTHIHMHTHTTHTHTHTTCTACTYITQHTHAHIYTHTYSIHTQTQHTHNIHMHIHSHCMLPKDIHAFHEQFYSYSQVIYITRICKRIVIQVYNSKQLNYHIILH